MSIVIITGLGKLVSWLCDWLPGLGGSALPGLIVLKLNRNWVRKIALKNKLRSVIISGTNGKTTTSYLLGVALKKRHIGFIRNSSGSNLMRGIASVLIDAADISGRLPTNLAIWEVDEAIVPEAIKQLKPAVVTLINLSRDQLDRYGELDHLLTRWQKALNILPKTSWVIINAADPRLKKLHFANLGYFGKGSKVNGRRFPNHLQGKFNYDNLWAVKAIGQALGLKFSGLVKLVQSTPPPFGRGESLNLRSRTYRLNLVKNPASFNTILHSLKQRRHLNLPLLIGLNDRLADGTDVSWIWDVDFNYLNKRRKPIVISGTRAHDLALRLKYTGVAPRLLKIEPDLNSAIKKLALVPGKTKYLLTTYTAMRQIRKIFGKQAWN